MMNTGFQPMKIAGVIAGMNNMARKQMKKRSVILRDYVRSGGKWDIE